MTVIAGYTDGKTWSIGGDSGAFDDHLYVVAAEPKVWKVGESLIGVAGSFRVMEIARKSGLSDPYALRSHLLEAQIGGDWGILVVTRKAVYEISDDFAVLKVKENYGSVGMGDAVALGALALLSQQKTLSREAVHTAMKIAGKHSTSAVPPFTVLTL